MQFPALTYPLSTEELFPAKLRVSRATLIFFVAVGWGPLTKLPNDNLVWREWMDHRGLSHRLYQAMTTGRVQARQ